MEYQEPLSVIINVSNIEYFNLHTYLTTLLSCPDGDDQSDWYMLVINNMQWNTFHTYACVDFII